MVDVGLRVVVGATLLVGGREVDVVETTVETGVVVDATVPATGPPGTTAVVEVVDPAVPTVVVVVVVAVATLGGHGSSK